MVPYNILEVHVDLVIAAFHQHRCSLPLIHIYLQLNSKLISKPARDIVDILKKSSTDEKGNISWFIELLKDGK